MTNSYEPGVYVKGDSRRSAYSASDAVALVFEGYKREEEATDEPAATEPAPVTSTAAVPDSTPVPRAPRRSAESSTDQKDTDQS